jgi:hypothetical protein
MYDATAQQQGWSPRHLGVAFDVEALISASYAIVADRPSAVRERKPGPESNAAQGTD